MYLVSTGEPTLQLSIPKKIGNCNNPGLTFKQASFDIVSDNEAYTLLMGDPAPGEARRGLPPPGVAKRACHSHISDRQANEKLRSKSKTLQQLNYELSENDLDPDDIDPRDLPWAVFRTQNEALKFKLKSDLARSKSPKTLACIEFWRGASLVTCRAERPELAHTGGGIRGGINGGFSPASRRNLMRTFAKTNRESIPLFLTLTYPGEYPTDWTVWKRDLFTFFKRLKLKYPAYSSIWRLEFQKRGAPHFHLFLYGLSDVNFLDLMAWAKINWYDVVGSGDEKHLRAGVRLEKLRHIRGAFAYASKYLSKNDEIGKKSVGRWWGVSGRKRIPFGILCVCAVSPCEAFDTIRLLKRFIGEHRNLPTINAFCDAEFWIRKLKFLYDTGWDRVYPNEYRCLESGRVTDHPI